VVDWGGGVFAGCLPWVQLFVSTCDGRLIDRLMCAAVVALSLDILLLCFITFIAFYCPVAFVNF